MANQLSDLRRRLEVSAYNPGAGNAANEPFDDGEELAKLAAKCSETAHDLLAELNSLQAQAQEAEHNMGKSIRSGIRIIKKKSPIKRIQNTLEQYRKILDTQILVNLRQQVNLVSIRQSESFHNLEIGVQNLILGLENGERNASALADLISQESASTRAQIDKRFLQHDQQRAVAEYRSRFLESLYFPEIKSRQENITEAHKLTFQWIFEGDFMEWLKLGRDIYWISGKAGSGKSTLMSYICQDSRTKMALQTCSANGKIIMPSFFFWNPGSEMQKSILGLLRSLLYQILEEYPDLIPLLATAIDQPGSLLLSSPIGDYNPKPIAAWTESRLKSTLQRIFGLKLLPCHVCLFIDGLDEFCGNYHSLIDIIKTTSQDPHVKLCVSCRPYRAFRDLFISSANLKLQDLTKQDIQIYTTDRLHACSELEMLAHKHPEWISKTVETIIGKAAGVFLWVRLAVDDQIEGFQNGDSLVQRTDRLNLLPAELEELYLYLLDKINNADRKEVVQYFRLVLQYEVTSRDGDLRSARLPLLQLALARYDRIDDFLRPGHNTTSQDIKVHCDLVARRINSICAGFLEIQYATPTEMSEAIRKAHKKPDNAKFVRENPLTTTQALVFDRDYRVEFLHRTTADFFKENGRAKDFLRTESIETYDPYTSYVKAELGTIVLFSMSDDGVRLHHEESMNVSENWLSEPEAFRYSVSRIMGAAYVLERRTGKAHTALMGQIDDTVTHMYRCFDRRVPAIHWCARWYDRGRIMPGYLQFNEINRRHGPNDRAELAQFFYSDVVKPTRGQHFSTPVPLRPIDFVGLAAFHNLNLYVRQRVDSRESGCDEFMPTYLLCCIFFHQSQHWAVARRLELGEFLLRRGACPNVVSGGDTPWKSLLMEIGWRPPSHPERKGDLWVQLVKAFLTSGADRHLNVKIITKCWKRMEMNVYKPMFRALASVESQIIGSQEVEVTFVFQHTLFRALQIYLGREHGFGDIQRMAIAEGAQLESGIFRIQCQVYGNKSTKGECNYESHYLSTMQSNKIMESIERLLGDQWIWALEDEVNGETGFELVIDEFIHEYGSSGVVSETKVDSDTDSIYYSAPSSPKKEVAILS